MNSTIILGVGSIAFSLLFRAQAADLPDTAQRLPVLLYWIVMGLAVLMIIEELLKLRKAQQANSATAPNDDEALPAINWPVLLLFGAAIVGYVVLIPIVGYLIMTPLFIAGALLVSRTMSPVKAIAIGIIATGFVWAVFIWALSLPVPILPFLK